MGLVVIGTAGSDEKCELAKRHGATYVINYRREDVVARVKDITGGAKLRVVYDSVGKDTWERSLDCLQPFGLMVSFGNASGAPKPLNLQILSQKGSLFLTRPTLFHYTATRPDLLAAADELFAVMKAGAVKVAVNHTFPLKDAAEAHRALEGRRTTGSIVLVP
jgi:NADPH2:quinone reductase